MKLVKSALVLASILAPAVAVAQPYGPPQGGYYAQPQGVEGGFHNRAGRLMWGVSIGIGGMTENGNDVSCNSCNVNPVAGEADFHIGGMLSHRFALMLEVQVNAQTVDASSGTTTDLVQTAVMAAAQYWLTPQLWLKGGLGVADLALNQSDYYGTVASTQPTSGTAVMAGAGFEIFSARNLAVDLQARLIAGNYSGISDHISSGTVGIGINWY
jgi:hypothetical protein